MEEETGAAIVGGGLKAVWGGRFIIFLKTLIIKGAVSSFKSMSPDPSSSKLLNWAYSDSTSSSVYPSRRRFFLEQYKIRLITLEIDTVDKKRKVRQLWTVFHSDSHYFHSYFTRIFITR